MVTMMDWYPSLLEWCGVDAPKAPLDGHRLQPVIDSAEVPSAHQVLHFQWRSSWAVRRGDWKLIAEKVKKPGGEVRYSLHNLAEDQPEVKDHAGEKPAMVQELIKLHEAWAQEIE